MGMLEAIKKGFGVASKNLVLILVLFVFNLIWNMVNIAIIPAGTVPVGGAGATTSPTMPPEVAFTTLIFSILFILVSIFMQGGSLGVVKDYIKEGKTKLSQFASYGLKYYLRLLGLGLIIILLVLIIAVIAALIVAATAPLNNIIATVIASIVAIAIGLVGIYFVILLVMSPYAMVSDETGIMEAMKRSMRVVKKSFWKILLLLVLLILIAIGIGVLIGMLTGLLTVALPVKIGQIVIGVVNSLFNGYFGIVMMASFMALYMALAGQEKTVAQKVF
ncbi:MAG: hypothetical protein Q7S30_01455 [Candidatus Omnitrophota bacterium]|nr:hypothetical protein [Candidatus Omnitrophota bacterium]